jgi:hypothetical protein
VRLLPAIGREFGGGMDYSVGSFHFSLPALQATLEL